MAEPAEFIPVLINGKTQQLNRAEVQKALADAKASLSPEHQQMLEKMFVTYLQALELIKSGQTTKEELLGMMLAPLKPAPKGRQGPDET